MEIRILPRGVAVAAALLFAVSLPGRAALVTHVPGDKVPPVVVSPPFGPLAAGGLVADNYIDFGVDYTHGGPEGVFDDGGGVLAFSGVSGGGIVDLLTPVDGRIVALGTHTGALTSYLFVEAGFASDGSLLLEVFNSADVLLDSVVNGPPLGPHGRTTMEIDRGGVFDVAWFRVSTPSGDTFGVNEVRIEAPVGAGVVPEPSTLALLGCAGLGLLRRRRR